MDQVHVPYTHIAAGREYLAQLQRLGLNPEGVFWGQWEGADEPHLFIITSLYDRFGPLQINQLLFNAYNASALPKEIDPFSVELHSPDHGIIRELMAHIGREKTRSITYMGIDAPDRHPNLDATQIRIANLTIPLRGLYVLDAPTMSRTDQYRAWNRFKREVSALAA